jgi:DNA polymerase (family 10)
MRANRAEELLEHAAEALKLQGADHVTVAGDLRRGCELVSELRLVGTSAAVGKSSRERLGEVTVDIVPPARRGSALLYATGSASHVAGLEALASSKKLVLTVDGVGRPGGPFAGDSEEAIYKRLGLPFIAPELREGNGEIELAQARALPKLVESRDIKGILHVHTDSSDGVHTLREMAEAARDLGYSYLGVSDHSRSAHYAGGLSVGDILRQHEEVETLNEWFGSSFRILKGIESDILADGSLDYPDDVLATFDFVVASVHSGFRRDRNEQTARILKAVANPFTTILGHITGRLLLRRTGYDVDVERVLEGCAEHGVAVEVNCNPNRLELDWRWHQHALKLGCLLSINPDAHSIRELGLVRWGIRIARKGGVEKKNVLNAMTTTQLLKYLQRRRIRGRKAA